jgi:hypothetical protein
MNPRRFEAAERGGHLTGAIAQVRPEAQVGGGGVAQDHAATLV